MILYPAIDLKDGQCVRLEQGEMDRATVFSDDPGDMAAKFMRLGFQRLHVVDLNGAFAGQSRNGEAVDAILAATDVPVQLGGGIRSMASIAVWLERGVSRVILGTAAAKEPDLVREACRMFPGRIVVGIDARNGMVAVDGWADATELRASELAMAFEDAGVAAIVHTDIGRDGMLTGLNLAETIEIASAVTTPVIASGGFSGMDDIARLAAPEAAKLDGAIIGRALYDGRLDPAAALAALPQAA
ncbi:1-(5-phosphoribosyl)-5-[(5-phosphoribosylamino)methylideneamino]imidazole-4-carboxamide isomerase [Acuticoccus sp. I52.16.1]|uniref:1-(5-phosphoribosyl)-5-[(5- phosphoribosylamino)methylideneamino]imidazole-4- carboxamide isomerase n=1 Tax=Acuticoccus sp. I52.16.1 TaxID=2928472 RepID=UPI001FD3F6FE|nr:1-(5-phosphoribosyl)-5-[(5-phosphoribosylamino)methylideneamino]imidazole-4-carboxamide isomerase [Acuticoccus sp. I52.16.1]UOM36882.1 1-(5-phosphoribosyl)-5-[(5-phosphoribosylamino)methylideneamino]imidazole-4-carboxamide isomerase [Acuticoccus sp. I52.16.1]